MLIFLKTICMKILMLCTNHQCFPILWMADVTPWHKKGRKELKEDYRSVSILPTLSKYFERIMFAQNVLKI